MNGELVENLKGAYVKRKRDAKKIYEVTGYNRSNRKYELVDIEDINSFLYVPRGTVLFEVDL